MTIINDKDYHQLSKTFMLFIIELGYNAKILGDQTHEEVVLRWLTERPESVNAKLIIALKARNLFSMVVTAKSIGETQEALTDRILDMLRAEELRDQQRS